MNNYHRGHFAELLACIYLRLKGYRILSRNYITGRGSTAGEIDCVAAHKNVIVFVEIKQRTSLTNAAYAITEAQKKRVIRGAESWLQHHCQYHNYDIRFDAILIVFPFNIRHIQNAWQKNE